MSKWHSLFFRIQYLSRTPVIWSLICKKYSTLLFIFITLEVKVQFTKTLSDADPRNWPRDRELGIRSGLVLRAGSVPESSLDCESLVMEFWDMGSWLGPRVAYQILSQGHEAGCRFGFWVSGRRMGLDSGVSQVSSQFLCRVWESGGWLGSRSISKSRLGVDSRVNVTI